MASRYPEKDIFPEGGIDQRDPAGVEWLANVWRPERANRIAVRPGFGQLTQQDCTAEKANVNSALSPQATGGYSRHLGSYLYNTNFGHRQIISIFQADVQHAQTDVRGWLPVISPSVLVGSSKTAVASIYDLTTGAQWEEPLIIHTSEQCRAVDIPFAHGHFETVGEGPSSVPKDFIKFHYDDSATNAAFKQIGDSVVISIGAYGVWIYHGVDVAKVKQRVLSTANIAPNIFTGAGFTVGTNEAKGVSEGSVLQPVTGVRGLNGEQFAYFTKTEFPRADVAALVKGRMVYALRGVLYFSDVGQPGALMADNFAEIQTEGKIIALGEHNGQLFAMTETEAHLIQFQQNPRAGDAFANVVNVSHVKISKRTGCVGPRALVETPFGVCWVSSKGVHMAGAQQSVQDLSDPISGYWDAGIVNPATHYYTSSGAGGTKTQPSVIYKHLGVPTCAYEPETESLMVAYDSHVLVYQFRHQAWNIWPLATTLDPTKTTALSTNLVSSYLPATQATTSWPDSTDANNMTGNLTAPPVFDGTQYYSIGNPANLQLGNNFSIEAWASQDPGTTGAERLVSRDDGVNRCFALYQMDTTGIPSVVIFIGGIAISASGLVSKADGNWHHYMVTHDGLMLRLYVDGVLAGSAAAVGPMDNDPVDWEIGRFDSGGGIQYLEGRCDSVRFYNATLSASEVLRNFNAGKLAHGGTTEPQSRQTINCLEVLSDSLGTYLVGGLLDQTEDGISPLEQSTSYYITELSRGGALDRSCKDEDERKHGWGRYEFSEDPDVLLAFDHGFLWSIEEPLRTFKTDDGAKIIYEFPVYLTCFRPATWPPPFGGLLLLAQRFELSWDSAFSFEGMGVFPESAPWGAWSFTNTASSFTAAREFIPSTDVTSCKLPMFVLRLSALTTASARTGFTVAKAQVVDAAAGLWDRTKVLLWQQQHLYASAVRSSDNRLVSSVEWGYKTGQIGMNEGKELRVRGINTVLETTTSQSSHLYNSFTVSDYKRLSGQFPDYANMIPGNRQQLLTDIIRERMLNGRRVFNSLARWAPVTSPNSIYLIDSPELNSIVTSVSGRGEHISVGLFGYATDKADELSLHRLSIGVLDTGNRRRKGR